MFSFYTSKPVLSDHLWLNMSFKIFETRLVPVPVPVPGTPAQPKISERDPESKHMTRSSLHWTQHAPGLIITTAISLVITMAAAAVPALSLT